MWIAAESAPIGGMEVVSRGRLHRLRDHPALIAWVGATRLGFAVMAQAGAEEAELLAIRAVTPWRGAGSALLAAVEASAKHTGASRLLAATTNDNVDALRFYQRRGFVLMAFTPDAFAAVRRLKGLPDRPEMLGKYGIPLRDELLLCKPLTER